ncbi:MAG: hypothetical protein CMI31_06250 [Opitutae bacterium]|nr:hypothetical protein [Opitutae bacterium]|tara:strand:- start:373 stop:1146 length:774 start_codon:yes stop_codon:yes gene_type:complete
MLPDTYDNVFKSETHHWWYVGRRAVIRRFLDLICPEIKMIHPDEALRILDYGCGTGFMLGLLGEYGEAIGADSSELSIELSRKRGHENVYLQKSHADLPESKCPFHLVTLLDVLEHVEDDIDLLKKLAEITADGGMLLITVPAYQWLWSGEDHVSQHYRRYSNKSLMHVIQKAGLEKVHLTYFNFWLLPIQIAVIFYNRLFRKEALLKSNVQNVPRYLNRLLSKIFSSEASILSRCKIPLGGSVLCIAKAKRKKSVD